MREVAEGDACPMCASARCGSSGRSRSATSSSWARATPSRCTPPTWTSPGQEHPIVMGSYGIGLGPRHGRRRWSSATTRRASSGRRALAPFDVHMVVIGGRDAPQRAIAERIAARARRARDSRCSSTTATASPGVTLRRRRADRHAGAPDGRQAHGQRAAPPTCRCGAAASRRRSRWPTCPTPWYRRWLSPSCRRRTGGAGRGRHDHTHGIVGPGIVVLGGLPPGLSAAQPSHVRGGTAWPGAAPRRWAWQRFRWCLRPRALERRRGAARGHRWQTWCRRARRSTARHSWSQGRPAAAARVARPAGLRRAPPRFEAPIATPPTAHATAAAASTGRHQPPPASAAAARLGCDLRHHLAAEIRRGRRLASARSRRAISSCGSSLTWRAPGRGSPPGLARARCRRDLTVPGGRSSSAAASSIDMPDDVARGDDGAEVGVEAGQSVSSGRCGAASAAVDRAGTSSTGWAVRLRRSITS